MIHYLRHVEHTMTSHSLVSNDVCVKAEAVREVPRHQVLVRGWAHRNQTRKHENRIGYQIRKIAVIFAESRNQMLKKGKPAIRKRHKNQTNLLLSGCQKPNESAVVWVSKTKEPVRITTPINIISRQAALWYFFHG